MNVPFYGIDREYEANKDQYAEIFNRVMKSGKIFEDEEVERLEDRIAVLTSHKLSYREKKRRAIAVNSCSDALYFSLLSAGVGHGDFVIVTDFSFLASAFCIVKCSAKPVFVDIGNDFLMDLEKCTYLDRAKAMIYVDLFGNCPDFDKVEAFCKKHHLILIEDAAQSFGGYSSNRPVGNMGYSSCISFDPTRVVGAPGSGGMILTSSDMALNYFRTQRKTHNSRMSELTAAILNYKLDFMPVWLTKREKIAEYYKMNISWKYEDSQHGVYQKFIFNSACRDDLRAHLSINRIRSYIHYKEPLHKQWYFRDYEYNDENFKNTNFACDTVLSLPIHPFMTDNEVEYVVKTINEF